MFKIEVKLAQNIKVEWYPIYGPKVCLNLVKIGLIVCYCTHEEKINFDGFTQNDCYGNHPQPFEIVFYNIREFKITTTATATRTSLNKRFNEQNNGLHVRYNPLYISLPSSAKQQREMTKFCVV